MVHRANPDRAQKESLRVTFSNFEPFAHVHFPILCRKIRTATMFTNNIFNTDHDEPFNGQNKNPLTDTTDDSSYATAFSTTNSCVPLTNNSVDSTIHISTSSDNNENTPTLADSDEIAALMAQVNDSLERELKETKKAVKRIFKEIVAFHEVSKSVHELWVPIQTAEHQESLRLDELQAEVHGTVGAYSVPMGSYINNTDSTDQNLLSK